MKTELEFYCDGKLIGKRKEGNLDIFTVGKKVIFIYTDDGISMDGCRSIYEVVKTSPICLIGFISYRVELSKVFNAEGYHLDED